MELMLSAVAEVFIWALKVSGRASVLILLILITQWLFRNRLTPAWRYGLWLLVLVRLLLPVAPQSSISVFNVTQSAVSVFSLRTTASENQPTVPNPFGTETSHIPADSVLLDPPQSQSGGELSEETSSTSIRALEIRERGDQSSGASSSGSWLLAVSLVWLAGVLLIAVRVACIPMQLNRQLARDHSVVKPVLLKALEEAQECMGVRRVLPIVQSAAVRSPALMGFIRPWLLLPEGMAERFTPQELRLIFLHELAHLKRHDIAINWLMTLLQILHWFNPLVWFAFSRMRVDREVACDALVLSRAGAGEQQPYGETMIKLLKNFTRPASMAGLAGILEDKHQMRRRMAMIAQFKKTSPKPVLALAMFAAFVLVALTDAQHTTDDQNLGNKLRNKQAAQVDNGVAIAGTQDIPKSSFQELTLRKLMNTSKYFSFSPFGNELVEGRHIGGWTRKNKGNNYTLLDLSNGHKRHLNVIFSYPEFSPDGKFLVGGVPDSKEALSGKPQTRKLALLDLSTAQTRWSYQRENLRPSYSGPIAAADWTEDGRSILVKVYKSDLTSEIIIISAEDGTVRVLKTLETNVIPMEAFFSPDGHWIVYDYMTGKSRRPRDINLLKLDGSREIPLVRHPANDELLGWAPDGNRILFSSDRRGDTDAYTIQVEDGKPLGEPELVKEGFGSVKRLGFTRDGSFLYEAQTDSTDVYIATLDQATGKVQGKPGKATRIEGRNKYPAWSRDGRYLAYISSRGTWERKDLICIRNIETGTVRELSTQPGYVTFPQWSHDGRHLFALGLREGGVYVYKIGLESGDSSVITSGDGLALITNVWPMWSWAPDRKSFYIQTSWKSMVRHDVVADGKKEISIPSNDYTIGLSPDGEQFVFSVTRKVSKSVTRTINVMPASGGESRQLLELVGAEAKISVSDDGLCWTADSRYVVFAKGKANNSKTRSLCRIPITGGEPEDLGLEMEGLRQPVISPDGRRIAFTAGGERREIWAMENFLPESDVAAK